MQEAAREAMRTVKAHLGEAAKVPLLRGEPGKHARNLLCQADHSVNILQIIAGLQATAVSYTVCLQCTRAHCRL
jgi:hypothetical protein